MVALRYFAALVVAMFTLTVTSWLVAVVGVVAMAHLVCPPLADWLEESGW